MRRRSASFLIVAGIVLSCVSATSAQIVVTPFASVNVGTTAGFFDLDDAAKDLHAGFGVSVSFLPDGWIGVAGETVFTPSAFSGGDLVESSRLFTVSGDLLVAAPNRPGRRLRPYVSLGAGVAHISSIDIGRFFVVDSTVPIATASVGTWIWFGPRIGVKAGLRFVRSLRTVESDSLETWQPSVGFSWRF
jgi:hypothetical protein